MAVVQNLNPDDQQNQQQQAGQTQQGAQQSPQAQAPAPGGPITLSGSATGPSSGAGQGQSSTAANSYNAQAPTSSGRYTNLQNYLTANQGYNAQGGGLAGQIQSNLQGQASNIQNQAGTAASQFQTGAQAQATPYNQALVNSAISNPYAFLNPDQGVSGGAKMGAGSGSVPGASTTGVATPPAATGAGNLAAWQSQLNASYTPQATNLQPYINQANAFQSTANLANSEPGRYTLLNQLYGQGGGYNQGQQGLDNLLLQGNQQQLAKLSQAPSLATNLQSTLAGQLGQENDLNTQLGAQAGKTKADTLAALSGAVDPLVAQAQAQAKAQQQAYTQAGQTALSQLQSGNVNADVANKLGLAGSTALYGVDPSASQYFTQGTATATPQNTLTTDQYKNFQALNQLAGTSLGGTAAGTELQPFVGASQVGQFGQQNPYTFDTANFNKDVGAAKTGYNNALQQFYGGLPSAETGAPGQFSYNFQLDPNAGIQSNVSTLQNAINNQGYTAPAFQQQLAALQGIMKQYGINAQGAPNMLNAPGPQLTQGAGIKPTATPDVGTAPAATPPPRFQSLAGSVNNRQAMTAAPSAKTPAKKPFGQGGNVYQH